MAAATQSIRYISDGTFSVLQARSTLDAHGVVVRMPSGETKYVPDDPTYPTTIFRLDGQIEFLLESSEELRKDEYAKDLSEWLGVKLQPVKD
jgi:hypothetical protein